MEAQTTRLARGLTAAVTRATLPRPVDSSPRWTVVQRATVCRCSVLTGRAHRRFGCVLLDSTLVLTGR